MIALEEPEQATLVEVALNFRAMNTDIQLLIYTSEAEKAAQASQVVETIFVETEAALSRFKPDSELSKLNRQGQLENASELLYQNVAAAWQMHELTGGIFDPTILDALEAAGYNRSFELIAGAKAGSSLLGATGTMVSYRNQQPLQLDPATRSIKLPFGIHIDLGGIAKGSTVDRAAKFLRQLGFLDFMLSAGGDMFLSGCPPQDKQGWTVAVQNPLTEASSVLTKLLISNQAVATSATTGRRWLVNGQNRHHLIDPRTGEPTNNNLAAVTAVADTVQLADVMAKTALILGPQQADKNLRPVAGLASLLFVTLQGEILSQSKFV